MAISGCIHTSERRHSRLFAHRPLSSGPSSISPYLPFSSGLALSPLIVTESPFFTICYIGVRHATDMRQACNRHAIDMRQTCDRHATDMR